MNISLQKVKSFPANWEIYRKMGREFGKDYDGECRSRQLNRKQMLAAAKKDCDTGSVFWILLDNRRIGYALAPHAPGDQIYLDTRYIEKKYRGQGIGTRVVELLKRDHKCHSARITMSRLETARILDSWTAMGFNTAIICGWLDPYFRYEIDNKVDDPHFFILTDEYYRLDDLKSLVPYFDLKDQRYVSEIRAEEEAA